MITRGVKVGNILDYGGGGRFVVIDIPDEGHGRVDYVGAKFMTIKDERECLHVANSAGDEGSLLKVEEQVLKPEEIFALITLGSANGQHSTHQWLPSLEELKEAAMKRGIMVTVDKSD